MAFTFEIYSLDTAHGAEKCVFVWRSEVCDSKALNVFSSVGHNYIFLESMKKKRMVPPNRHVRSVPAYSFQGRQAKCSQCGRIED